jgi:hypothetical protein
LTTGIENTTLGYLAGSAVTTGNYNVIIGSSTNYITTGSQNTVVGRSSGQSLNTGTYNVYLGYKAGGTADVNNTLFIARSNTNASNAATWIYGDGSGNLYQGNNSSTWSTTSDIRLKKDVVDSPKGLNEINQLRVTNFYYKEENEIDMSEFPLVKEPSEVCLADEDKGGKLQTGLIAQEVESVLPECIKESIHGVKTVDSDPIQWAMIKAIQELSARVEELESKSD